MAKKIYKNRKYRVKNTADNNIRCKMQFSRTGTVGKLLCYYSVYDYSQVFSWRIIDMMVEEFQLHPKDAYHMWQSIGQMIKYLLNAGYPVGVPNVGAFHIQKMKIQSSTGNGNLKFGKEGKTYSDIDASSKQYYKNKVRFRFSRAFERGHYPYIKKIGDLAKDERKVIYELRESIPNREITEANGRRLKYGRGLHFARRSLDSYKLSERL